MGNLIDDLLAFSRIGRAETKKTLVSLDQLVKEAVAEIGQETEGTRYRVEDRAPSGLLRRSFDAEAGDRSILSPMRSNSRACEPRAEIEIGCVDRENEVEVFVQGQWRRLRHAVCR